MKQKNDKLILITIAAGFMHLWKIASCKNACTKCT